MTLDGVLQELIQCLAHDGDTLLSWDQVRQWPKGAVEVFQNAGWIVSAPPATMVVCPGCEESCYMLVAKVLPKSKGLPARAYVACDQRSDMGTVKFHPARLKQWQLTQGQLARWVSSALGMNRKPEKDGTGGLFKLGTIQGNERIGTLEFDAADSACLKSSGHSLPLAEIVSLVNDQPVIDQAAILNMVDLPPAPAPKVKKKYKKPTVDAEGLEIGSTEWRSQTARNAANARHDQPGGSRDKQQRIRDIWATGKYTSRDRCAEEEYAALDMSYSAARKALINTPDSTPSA
jgi:hypothetical protein